MSEKVAGVNEARPWPMTGREQVVLSMYYQKHGATGSAPHSNLVYAVVLRGAVDPAALEAAAQRLFVENPVLHSFFSAPDEPVQKYQPDPLRTPAPFRYCDHSGNGRSFKQSVRDAIATRFDLREGRLVRLTLVKRSRNRFFFVLTAHHMLMDGWSILMLLRTLSKYYVDGKVRSGVPGLGNEEVMTYLEQRNAYLNSAECDADRHALKDWIAPIADHLQPRVNVAFPMATEVQRLLRFDVELVERAMITLRISGIELHRILYVMMIHWLSGDTEIGFSESHTCRSHRARRLFGYFSDDLLIRVSLEDMSGASIAAAVRAGYEKALDFQRVPAMRVLVELLGAPKLPRFHFNPIGGVVIDALRIKGASAQHVEAMKSYALAEVNFVGFDPQHVFIALAAPMVEGRSLDDMEAALGSFLRVLAEPQAAPALSRHIQSD